MQFKRKIVSLAVVALVALLPLVFAACGDPYENKPLSQSGDWDLTNLGWRKTDNTTLNLTFGLSNEGDENSPIPALVDGNYIAIDGAGNEYTPVADFDDAEVIAAGDIVFVTLNFSVPQGATDFVLRFRGGMDERELDCVLGAVSACAPRE